ncbi:MAG: hypothetical protein ABI210_04625 [Abditibacteriaceae bacterium]
MNRSIRSRATRILGRFENYQVLTLGDNTPLECAEMQIQCTEELLGIYTNHLDTEEGKIVVSDLGLHLYHSNTWRFIGYDQIRDITLPDYAMEHKELADALCLKMISGKLVVIPVSGGNGQFRDAFEFMRFLLRIIDSHLTTSSN